MYNFITIEIFNILHFFRKNRLNIKNLKNELHKNAKRESVKNPHDLLFDF